MTFDPAKRDATLFADAAAVFEGVTVEVQDTRKNYGEPRTICFGVRQGRIVVVGYTPRGADRHVFSRGKPMNANKPASRRSLNSDFAQVDAHQVQPSGYEELPEMTDDMMARATVNKGGRPLSANPRKLISLRLPADVIERWKASGPGWQTRMAERLSKLR